MLWRTSGSVCISRGRAGGATDSLRADDHDSGDPFIGSRVLSGRSDVYEVHALSCGAQILHP